MGECKSPYNRGRGEICIYERDANGPTDLKCCPVKCYPPVCYDKVDVEFSCGTTTTTTTTQPPYKCHCRVIVIWVCNSNAAKDDDIYIYLNDIELGRVDLSANDYTGGLFIGHPTAYFPPATSQGETKFGNCPLSKMFKAEDCDIFDSLCRFDPDYLFETDNEVRTELWRANDNGNAGTINITSYKLNEDDSLTDPCELASVGYSTPPQKIAFDIKGGCCCTGGGTGFKAFDGSFHWYKYARVTYNLNCITKWSQDPGPYTSATILLEWPASFTNAKNDCTSGKVIEAFGPFTGGTVGSSLGGVPTSHINNSSDNSATFSSLEEETGCGWELSDEIICSQPYPFLNPNITEELYLNITEKSKDCINSNTFISNCVVGETSQINQHYTGSKQDEFVLCYKNKGNNEFIIKNEKDEIIKNIKTEKNKEDVELISKPEGSDYIIIETIAGENSSWEYCLLCPETINHLLKETENGTIKTLSTEYPGCKFVVFLETTGCCIEIDGDKLYAVGDGTLYASVDSGSPGDGEGLECCRNPTVKICEVDCGGGCEEGEFGASKYLLDGCEFTITVTGQNSGDYGGQQDCQCKDPSDKTKEEGYPTGTEMHPDDCPAPFRIMKNKNNNGLRILVNKNFIR